MSAPSCFVVLFRPPSRLSSSDLSIPSWLDSLKPCCVSLFLVRLSLSCPWLASAAFGLGQFSPILKQTSPLLKLPPCHPPLFLFKRVFHLSQIFWTIVCSLSRFVQFLLTCSFTPNTPNPGLLVTNSVHFLAPPAYFFAASDLTGNMHLLGAVSPLGFQDNNFSCFPPFSLCFFSVPIMASI